MHIKLRLHCKLHHDIFLDKGISFADDYSISHKLYFNFVECIIRINKINILQAGISTFFFL